MNSIKASLFLLLATCVGFSASAGNNVNFNFYNHSSTPVSVTLKDLNCWKNIPNEFSIGKGTKSNAVTHLNVNTETRNSGGCFNVTSKLEIKIQKSTKEEGKEYLTTVFSEKSGLTNSSSQWTHDNPNGVQTFEVTVTPTSGYPKVYHAGLPWQYTDYSNDIIITNTSVSKIPSAMNKSNLSHKPEVK